MSEFDVRRWTFSENRYLPRVNLRILFALAREQSARGRQDSAWRIARARLRKKSLPRRQHEHCASSRVRATNQRAHWKISGHLRERGAAAANVFRRPYRSAKRGSFQLL